MLRKLLDYKLALTAKDKPLHRFRPLVEAVDTFLYEPLINTKSAPHIRDAIDIKRWMLIVVFALMPAFLMAIWNSGLQTFVYTSFDYQLMNEYLASTQSFSNYFDFVLKDQRYLTIVWLGLKAVMPIVIITYAVGGLCEAIFAVVRGHEISEGFLVTGILYSLILPSTISYWMVAVGVFIGIALSKEVFGGSGYNIVNPALTCRAFLFFTFPGRMSGDVWAGTNITKTRQSIMQMNSDSGKSSVDAYSQATPLARFNVTHDIKKVHVDAIAANRMGQSGTDLPVLNESLSKWSSLQESSKAATLADLSPEQLQSFVTSPLQEGGLGLNPGNYEDAYHLASLSYGLDNYNSWNLFFGDRLGSIGETSMFTCLLGAIFLIWTGVGSWRTMLAMALGAFCMASIFQFATLIGADGGAWNSAVFAFPAYKHLILGGLAFGLVFMITDPVSSPGMNLSRWIYGILAGVVTIIIRTINPAYPEGVMLAILMANVFAPLIDYYVLQYDRKRSMRRAKAK